MGQLNFHIQCIWANFQRVYFLSNEIRNQQFYASNFMLAKPIQIRSKIKISCLSFLLWLFICLVVQCLCSGFFTSSLSLNIKSKIYKNLITFSSLLIVIHSMKKYKPQHLIINTGCLH